MALFGTDDKIPELSIGRDELLRDSLPQDSWKYKVLSTYVNAKSYLETRKHQVFIAIAVIFICIAAIFLVSRHEHDSTTNFVIVKYNQTEYFTISDPQIVRVFLSSADHDTIVYDTPHINKAPHNESSGHTLTRRSGGGGASHSNNKGPARPIELEMQAYHEDDMAWLPVETVPLTIEREPLDVEHQDISVDSQLKEAAHFFRMAVTGTNASEAPWVLRTEFMNMPRIAAAEVAIAALILIIVYVLIIFEVFNRTLVALLGSFLAVGTVSALQHRPTFHDIVGWIDFDTIGLLFGMMVMVGIFSTTGFFEWSAVRAYKYSKGDLWRLTLILCGFTAVASAFLDNVTTILLLAPVTIRLCKVIDIRPEPILVAEVMFSNIGGTATPIGDPPNIIIVNDRRIQGSGQVSFMSFTLHMLPGIILVGIALVPVLKRLISPSLMIMPRGDRDREIEIWRKTAEKVKNETLEERHVRQQLDSFIAQLEFDSQSQPTSSSASMVDITELEAKYIIHDRPLFISSSVVLGVVILLFFLHSVAHIDVSLVWIAIIGSLIHLLVADIHNLEEVLEKVEFGTLLFFAGLFVLMRGLEELGLIKFIGDLTEAMIAGVPSEYNLRLLAAVSLLIWVSAVVSAFVDNIPFTTTMVPVVYQLGTGSLNLPLTPLVWALAYGTCLGGNGTLIGASANVVAVGMAEQEGFPISFNDFFKIGFPVMVASVLIAHVWVVFHVLVGWY